MLYAAVLCARRVRIGALSALRLGACGSSFDALRGAFSLPSGCRVPAGDALRSVALLYLSLRGGPAAALARLAAGGADGGWDWRQTLPAQMLRRLRPEWIPGVEIWTQADVGEGDWCEDAVGKVADLYYAALGELLACLAALRACAPSAALASDRRPPAPPALLLPRLPPSALLAGRAFAKPAWTWRSLGVCLLLDLEDALASDKVAGPTALRALDAAKLCLAAPSAALHAAAARAAAAAPTAGPGPPAPAPAAEAAAAAAAARCALRRALSQGERAAVGGAAARVSKALCALYLNVGGVSGAPGGGEGPSGADVDSLWEGCQLYALRMHLRRGGGGGGGGGGGARLSLGGLVGAALARAQRLERAAAPGRSCCAAGAGGSRRSRRCSRAPSAASAPRCRTAPTGPPAPRCGCSRCCSARAAWPRSACCRGRPTRRRRGSAPAPCPGRRRA